MSVSVFINTLPIIKGFANTETDMLSTVHAYRRLNFCPMGRFQIAPKSLAGINNHAALEPNKRRPGLSLPPFSQGQAAHIQKRRNHVDRKVLHPQQGSDICHLKRAKKRFLKYHMPTRSGLPYLSRGSSTGCRVDLGGVSKSRPLPVSSTITWLICSPGSGKRAASWGFFGKLSSSVFPIVPPLVLPRKCQFRQWGAAKRATLQAPGADSGWYSVRA